VLVTHVSENISCNIPCAGVGCKALPLTNTGWWNSPGGAWVCCILVDGTFMSFDGTVNDVEWECRPDYIVCCELCVAGNGYSWLFKLGSCYTGGDITVDNVGTDVELIVFSAPLFVKSACEKTGAV
jgi:hypothetical protein